MWSLWLSRFWDSLNFSGFHIFSIITCKYFSTKLDNCAVLCFQTFQVNAEKVAVSGKKRNQKLYRRHSGRPGGMTVETFDQLQQRIPERIIEHAVRGMLPKGRVSSLALTYPICTLTQFLSPSLYIYNCTAR